MALILYRRHAADCAVHASGLPARAKRYWAECACPIWIYGTTSKGIYNRQATGLRDMAAAEALRRSLEAEGAVEAEKGPLLREAAERWLALAGRSEASQRHYRTLLERLCAFTEARGAFFMRDLTVDLLEDFRAFGQPSLKSGHSQALASRLLKRFLREALRRGWLREDLGARLAQQRLAREQKLPFTEREMDQILNGHWHFRKRGLLAKPETFRLLMRLMLETGLRVSDALLFDPGRLEKGDALWRYAFVPLKLRHAGTLCEVWLSGELKEAIEKASWFSKELPFKKGPVEKAYWLVWSAMQRIGEAEGIADCRPHRLRDTFAVRCLLRGLQLQDVARLLGHSSVLITERFYAAWVPERRARLERLLAQTQVDALRNGNGDRQAAAGGALEPQAAGLAREKAADGVPGKPPKGS